MTIHFEEQPTPIPLTTPLPTAEKSRALSANTGYFESVSELRQVFQRLGVGVMLMDPYGRIVDVNRKFLTIFQMTKEQALAASIVEDLSDWENSEEHLEEILHQVLKGQEVVIDWPALRSDAMRINLEVTFNLMENQQPPLIVACIQDVTRQRLTELELRHSEEQLNYQVTRLHILHMISSHLAGVKELATFFQRYHEIFDYYRKTLGAHRTTLMLYIRDAGMLISEDNMDPDNPNHFTADQLQEVGYGISGKVAMTGQTVVDNDCEKNGLTPLEWVRSEGLKSCMAVPLHFQEEFLGVLRIDNQQMTNAFSSSDAEFWQTVGELLGSSLHNAQVIGELSRVAGQARQSQEMVKKAFNAKQAQMEEIAKVQSELLPARYEPICGIAIAAQCRPCADVGGDFYAFHEMADGRVAICIGDVSGHGAKATIATATSRAFLRAALMEVKPEEGPAEVLCKMNHWFQDQLGVEHFVTMWLGIFDPGTEELSYAAQAHPHAVLWRSGETPKYLKHPPAFPLGLSGVDPELPETQVLDFQLGDRIIGYTDGWVESPDMHGVMLEDEAFLEFLLDAEALPLEQVPMVLFMNLERHAANTAIKDDITIIAFDRIS